MFDPVTYGAAINAANQATAIAVGGMTLTDAGSYYTDKTVEGAMQEVGESLSSLSITDLQDPGWFPEESTVVSGVSVATLNCDEPTILAISAATTGATITAAGLNLFDVSQVAANYIINSSGVVVNGQGFTTSGKTRVPAGQNITLSRCKSYVWYRPDGVTVDSYSFKSSTILRTLAVPATAAYIQFDCVTDILDMSEVMAVYGSYTAGTMPAFEAYVTPLTAVVAGGTAEITCPTGFATVFSSAGTFTLTYSGAWYNAIKNLATVEDLEDYQKIELSLPDTLYSVAGDRFELYFSSIIPARNIENYFIEIECSVGNHYKRKYVYQTPVAGTYAMTIGLYDSAHNLLDEKTTSLVVSAVASSPVANKNFLIVGDSTMDEVLVDELYRRLTDSGGTPAGDNLSNITFVGTRQTSTGVKYEGYGGYTYAIYNSAGTDLGFYWVTVAAHSKTAADQKSIFVDANSKQWQLETIETLRLKMKRYGHTDGEMPASGTLTYVSGGSNTDNIVFSASEEQSGNPFYIGSSVDFTAYCTAMGITGLDYCYVLLGWNSTSDSETTIKNAVRAFIGNLRADYPNCKIAIMGITPPSEDGLGANYGCDWSYFDSLTFMHNTNAWYEEVVAEYTNAIFIDTSAQFDGEFNMQLNTRDVNPRNSTYTEIYGINGVHPGDPGYLQMADAAYRGLMYQLQ